MIIRRRIEDISNFILPEYSDITSIRIDKLVKELGIDDDIIQQALELSEAARLEDYVRFNEVAYVDAVCLRLSEAVQRQLNESVDAEVSLVSTPSFVRSINPKGYEPGTKDLILSVRIEDACIDSTLTTYSTYWESYCRKMDTNTDDFGVLVTNGLLFDFLVNPRLAGTGDPVEPYVSLIRGIVKDMPIDSFMHVSDAIITVFTVTEVADYLDKQRTELDGLRSEFDILSNKMANHGIRCTMHNIKETAAQGASVLIAQAFDAVRDGCGVEILNGDIEWRQD